MKFFPCCSRTTLVLYSNPPEAEKVDCSHDREERERAGAAKTGGLSYQRLVQIRRDQRRLFYLEVKRDPRLRASIVKVGSATIIRVSPEDYLDRKAREQHCLAPDGGPPIVEEPPLAETTVEPAPSSDKISEHPPTRGRGRPPGSRNRPKRTASPSERYPRAAAPSSE
jgi:hypothetical protein